MNIFEASSYKAFVRESIQSRSRRGRGEFARLAEVAQTHKATISQIFSGDKHLTPEQAVRVAQYLGLRPREQRFFVLLVNYERAGSEDLRILYREQIEREAASNRELSVRLDRTRDLTDEERAIFYSNWIYSAVRVLSSIPGFQTRNNIAARLKVPPDLVGRVLETLLHTGLCIEKNGLIEPGPQQTHLSSKSPLASRHHGNWRIKAMEKHPVLRATDELAYTAPVSLSSQDVMKIREILMQAIEKADRLIAPSACERIFCLNVDWFEV